jgi:DNA-binding NarL/FixJ family response regulator
MSGQSRISTVTVSDDHPVFIEGVKDLLARQADLDVVGQANCSRSSLDLVNQHKPDVAILDLSMPGDIFQTISEITRTNTHTRSIVYTAYCSVDSAVKALEAGATGFVLKSDPIEELLDAIRARDQLVISKKFSTEVLTAMRARQSAAPPAAILSLSRREKQVVGQLLLGQTNREIARMLDLTEQTVKHYMTSLMHKLKVRSRVEVVVAIKKSQSALDDVQDA